MKRMTAALLLAAACLLLAQGAFAEGTTYVFPYEGFRYTQADGETVLTQTNLSRYEALIESLGTTRDAMLASYIASGIVMEVLPDGGGQIAVSVTDAGDFSDVTRMDELDEARLNAFAAQFEQSGLYESCVLMRTTPVCVRLTSSAMYGSMPVYTLRYATLHLGRLYMLSQSVVGREPQPVDDERMTRVLSRMELLSALAEPTAMPVPTPTAAPTPTPQPTPGTAQTVSQTGELTVEGVPAYTNEAALTVSGKAAPNAAVRVRVGERTLGQTKSDADGAFSVAVTLPSPGDVTLSVMAGDAEQTLALVYELPCASLRITEPQNPVFTGDNVLVRGVTEPEATVYINGKGMSTNVKANRSGEFSVRVFMRDAETLTFTLRAHLRGFTDNYQDVTLTRELTEREAIAEFRNGVIGVTYAQLAANPADYRGRKFSFRGRIAEFADYDGTPCALVLVNNVSTGVWRDPVWIVLPGAQELAEGDVRTFYLEGEGTSLPVSGAYTQDGQSAEAPVARAAYVIE